MSVDCGDGLGVELLRRSWGILVCRPSGRRGAKATFGIVAAQELGPAMDRVAAVEVTARYATLRGPFSRVVDEQGTTYRRGIPQALTAESALLLSQPPFASLFVLSQDPVTLDQSDPRWTAVLPEQAPCGWKGDFALLAGPFVEAQDDDHHVFRRGEPLEICSKTLKVLETDGYAPHFAILNRASEPVGGGATRCAPTGGCC